MKKFLILSLCVLLCFGMLCGCTKTDTDTNDGSQTPNNNQTQPNDQNQNQNDSQTPNNGQNQNGGSDNSSDRLEELTDAEKASLREQIDAIDGLTYSDITFNGTTARLKVQSELAEFGDDVKSAVEQVLRGIRPKLTTVEIVK